ncbi:MAG: TolC family protein [Planctomycetes bacterium]|nr:TolC family protein [Planctomycetota bacterium]
MARARFAAALVALALLLPFLPLPLRADPAATPGTGSGAYQRTLSLRDCVQLALANNSDLAIEKFNPEIRAAELNSLYGEFDLVAFIKSSTQKGIRDSGSAFEGLTSLFSFSDAIASSNIKHSAGFRKKWEFGTTMELTESWERQRTPAFFFARTTPQYVFKSEFKLTQPLARGFGWTYNQTPIYRGEMTRLIAEYKYAEVALDTVANVEKAYWDLVSANRELESRRRSFELTAKLLETAREKAKVGGDAIAGIQAEADLAAQRDGLLTADAAVRNAQDALKKLLFPLGDVDYWRIEVQAADAAPPGFALPKAAELVDKVNDRRPEWRAARKEIATHVMDLIRAENDTLPKADFKYTYARQAVAEDGDLAVVEHIDENFWDYTVAFEFEMPLGNREAKNKLRKVELELAQSRVKLNAVERRIGVEVVEAYREARNALDRIEAAKKTVELTGKKLKAESEKYGLGLASIQFVLQYERDLSDAQLTEVKAQVDYAKAWVKLRRALGTTLDTYDVLPKG